MSWTKVPDNRLDRSQQATGLFTLSADEAAGQAYDVELDLRTYADGGLSLDNGRDYDENHNVRLTPSQVAKLRAVLMTDMVENALNQTLREKEEL